MSEREGHILLADISGYTGFLKADTVTLRHATLIVSTLLDAMIKAARPPIAANKIEGDAVLFVGMGESRTASAARESVEAVFAAFYRRRRRLIAANTCPCEACRKIASLDLKVIAHKGPLLRHKVGRFDEISGLPLVVVHRLSKNGANRRRYLLATETAWEDVRPGVTVDIERRVETCGGIGPVPVVLVDPPGLDGIDTDPARSTSPALLADWLWKHLTLLPGLAQRRQGP